MKTTVDKDVQKDHVGEARHKLLREILGTAQYEIGCLRRCHNEYVIMKRRVYLDPSGTKAWSLPVLGCDKNGDDHEDDDEVNVEKKYKLLMNILSKTVWDIAM